MGIVSNMMSLTRFHGCRTAFAWLPLAFVLGYVAIMSSIVQCTVCPFQILLDRECPTCGTTRAIYCLFTGQFAAAFITNPIAYVATIALIRHGILRSFPRNRRVAWLDSRAIDTMLLASFFIGGYLHSFAVLSSANK